MKVGKPKIDVSEIAHNYCYDKLNFYLYYIIEIGERLSLEHETVVLKSNDLNCKDSFSVIRILRFDCTDNLDIIFSKRKQQIDLLIATLFCSNRGVML